MCRSGLSDEDSRILIPHTGHIGGIVPDETCVQQIVSVCCAYLCWVTFEMLQNSFSSSSVITAITAKRPHSRVSSGVIYTFRMLNGHPPLD